MGIETILEQVIDVLDNHFSTKPLVTEDNVLEYVVELLKENAELSEENERLSENLEDIAENL